jgi:Cu+-exporting ATPase
LPKKNLLILLDAVLGNIANKNPNLPASEQKQFEGKSQDIDLAVEGMSCASCALLIEMVLKRDERVKTANVNFSTSTLSVQGQLSKADVNALVTKIGCGRVCLVCLSL